ncbi:hypothetical protein HBI66_152900 [Parastagonospora nodorum]|nr:hypothetical protein HBI74_185600 [Parastagonospora nodorum]KAH5595308.1 hypothetical protein HBI45_187120 [Parastagonospora nodorum]KAH6066794.1 hypothetical protein HBI66_152900 [Parastagonospora nodorum]
MLGVLCEACGCEWGLASGCACGWCCCCCWCWCCFGGLVLRRGGGGRAGGRRRLGRVVRLGLVQVEGARGALRRRGRQRRRRVDGRGRAVEIVGALRVLRPLLLEESEGRHRSGGGGRGSGMLDAVLVLTLMLARCPGWRCQWLFLCRGRAITNDQRPTAAAALVECARPQWTARRRRRTGTMASGSVSACSTRTMGVAAKDGDGMGWALSAARAGGQGGWQVLRLTLPRGSSCDARLHHLCVKAALAPPARLH